MDLSLKIRNLELKNPILTASGTFGYGEEFEDFIDIAKLGAIVVKGTTLEKREGNPYPRLAETPSGMINAIGLQNKGIDYFLNNILPRIKKYNTKIIVNVNGSKVEEYVKLASILNDIEQVQAIEVNISCPNVKEGGLAFGVSCPSAAAVTKEVRKVYDKAMIVKLSPNVTDIAEIARHIEAQGADAVSLVNTFLAMAINAKTRRPVLSTITGGLSGPCIKPIALRMVWQVSNAVKIPVIGMGGIMNGEDAIEFLIAGANAIQVGTANFIDPKITIKILDYIKKYMKENKFNSIKEIVMI